jgi:hypothetical protein
MARWHFDLNQVRRVAGDREGSILLEVSDACAAAGVVAEELWLILEVLDERDFVETRTHGNHRLDVYHLQLAAGPQCDVGFFLVEMDHTPRLMIASFQARNSEESS